MHNKKKFISLKIKVLASLLLMTAIFALFCLALIQGGENKSLEQSLVKRAESMAESLAAFSAGSLSGGPGAAAESEKMQKAVLRLEEQPGVKKIEILNSAGKVKATTVVSELGSVKDSDQTAKEVMKTGLAGSSASISGSDSFVQSVVPVRSGEICVGAVRVKLSAAEIGAASASLKRRLIGLAFILAACSLMFTALMVYWYGNPLLGLAEAADKLAQGKLETRADESGNDEIAIAASRINRLAAYIKKIIVSSQTEISDKSDRIRRLRMFADSVLSGDFSGQAAVEDIDELGQLTMSINELVRYMRTMSAAEEALQGRVVEAERISASCPTIGDLNTSVQESAANPVYYQNRVLPSSETVIAAQAPEGNEVSPSEAPTQIGSTSTELPAPPPQIGAIPAMRQSLAPLIYPGNYAQLQAASGPRPQPFGTPAAPAQMPDVSLDQVGELSSSQIRYVNEISALGAGCTALVATQGTEDTYPFLRSLLESEGFMVLHASNVNEMLEVAEFAGVQLIVVEFNEIDGGNQNAVNRLHTSEACKDISVLVLEASYRADAAYSSMKNVVQVMIPNSDEEMAAMIREALAEILLTGGSDPFLKKK